MCVASDRDRCCESRRTLISKQRFVFVWEINRLAVGLFHESDTSTMAQPGIACSSGNWCLWSLVTRTPRLAMGSGASVVSDDDGLTVVLTKWLKSRLPTFIKGVDSHWRMGCHRDRGIGGVSTWQHGRGHTTATFPDHFDVSSFSLEWRLASKIAMCHWAAKEMKSLDVSNCFCVQISVSWSQPQIRIR